MNPELKVIQKGIGRDLKDSLQIRGAGKPKNERASGTLGGRGALHKLHRKPFCDDAFSLLRRFSKQYDDFKFFRLRRHYHNASTSHNEDCALISSIERDAGCQDGSQEAKGL
jgi:hypothetical protein